MSDYKKEGLLLHLDGFQNSAVEEHNTDASTWVDLSENGNSGKITGCTWSHNGLNFFGSSGYKVVTEQINTPFITLEIIAEPFRLTTTSTETENNIIISNYQAGGWGLRHMGEYISFLVYIDGAYREVRGDKSAIGKMNYYTCTYDGAELCFYQNGVLISKMAVEGEIQPPSNDTYVILGGNADGQEIKAGYFYGRVNMVRLYDHALTAEEVKNNYEYNYKRFYYDTLQIDYLGNKNGYLTEPGNTCLSDVSKYYKGPTYFFSYKKDNSNYPYRPTFLSLYEQAVDSSKASRKSYFYYKGFLWFWSYISSSWIMGDDLMPLVKDQIYTDTTTACKAFIDKYLSIYELEKPQDATTGRIKYVKVREDDGTYSDAILLAVDALNVDFPDGENLIQKLSRKAEKEIYGDNGINLGRNTNSEKGTNTNAFGFSNSIPGDYGVAEGQNNIIYGQFGHTEGQENTIDATTEYGHAEGYKNQVNGNYGHAEGQENIVSGIGAHAEGLRNAATGDYSHAQGQNNVASGAAAAVMGEDTTAEGIASLAIGKGTTAKGNYSFVHGKYNSTKNYDRYAEIVGGGEAPEAGDNIYTLDWEGNAKFKGNVSAELFNGKATKDIKGRDLTSYIRELSAEKNVLTYVKGDGTEERVALTGWENVQEKYNSLTNENAITVGKSQREIISMEYRNATSHISNAIFQSILVVYAGVDPGQTHAVVKFDIRIDDVSVDALFIPTETLCKGYHIINLMYPVMDIEPEVLHTISVVATCTTGNIAIGQNNIKTVFYGMGINSGKTRWDGRIDIGDHLETITIIPKRRSPYITFVPPIDNGPSIHIDEPYPKLVFEEHLGAVTIRSRQISKIKFEQFRAYPESVLIETRYIFSSVKWPYYIFDERYVNVQETNLYQLRTNFNVLATKENIDSGISEKLPLELERFSKFTQIEIKEDYIG